MGHSNNSFTMDQPSDALYTSPRIIRFSEAGASASDKKDASLSSLSFSLGFETKDVIVSAANPGSNSPPSNGLAMALSNETPNNSSHSVSVLMQSPPPKPGDAPRFDTSRVSPSPPPALKDCSESTPLKNSLPGSGNAKRFKRTRRDSSHNRHMRSRHVEAPAVNSAPSPAGEGRCRVVRCASECVVGVGAASSTAYGLPAESLTGPPPVGDE